MLRRGAERRSGVAKRRGGGREKRMCGSETLTSEGYSEGMWNVSIFLVLIRFVRYVFVVLHHF